MATIRQSRYYFKTKMLVLIIGLVILSGCTSKDDGKPSTATKASKTGESFAEHALHEADQYVCPMHPQIRESSEGRCPICGMDLVKVETEGAALEGSDMIKISPASRRLSGIKTHLVIAENVNKTISASGNIAFDETRLSTIATYVNGRIEQLYANFTGVKVKKGDALAVLYSPELYALQVEYLETRRTFNKVKKSSISAITNTQRELMNGARTRLLEFGLTTSQIKKLETSGKGESRITIHAPISGTVISKHVVPGQYVKTGQVIFKIADLSYVWLMIDLFPEDAGFVRFGQKVAATVRSRGSHEISGRVVFVDPVVREDTRTVRVRVEIPNPSGSVRPGDYADANLIVPVSVNPETSEVYDEELAKKWISPMHPQIIRNEPGKCPICGMDLISTKSLGYADEEVDEEGLLAVPRDAVLTVGKHSVVFLDDGKGHFKLQRVKTGPTVGDRIVITEGLKEMQRVASSGVFLIDSQMQLSGKTSLIDIEANEAKSVKAEENKEK